jgi:hypothetical protein
MEYADSDHGVFFYYLSIHLEGPRKVTKHQSDIQHPGQDLIQSPLEYLLKVLLLLLTFYF